MKLIPLIVAGRQFWHTFPDVATITPPNAADTGRGNESIDFSTFPAVEYACLLSAARQHEYRLFAEQPMPGSLYKLRLWQGVEIDPLALIVINGLTYRLVIPSTDASISFSETYFVVRQTH